MSDFRRTRDERKDELEHELGKLDLSLRYDSRLCSCYISGQTSADWTAALVANECALMHWLYNYTDYEERCRVAALEESKVGWFHSGRHFSDYMKRRVYPTIKERIIKDSEGELDAWPWMKKEKEKGCKSKTRCSLLNATSSI